MVQEGLVGLGILVGYYIAAVLIIFLLRSLFVIPGELMRKMLHLVCAMSVYPLLYAFQTWYVAVLGVAVFMLLAFPLIGALAKIPKLYAILRERKHGEIRSSLMIVSGMQAILITIFWGILGEEWKYVILVAIMAWGFGDAAAALVGKAVGKHKIRHRWVEGTKTWEGSAAMYIASAVAVFVTLMICAPLPWLSCLLITLIVSFVSAYVEVISHHGVDTITVPLAVSASTYALVQLFVWIGGML